MEHVRPSAAALAQLAHDDALVDWPPAARAVRAAPPTVRASSAAAAGAPREAPPSDAPPARRAPLMGEIRERDAADVRRADPDDARPMSAFRRSRMLRAQKAAGAARAAPAAPAPPAVADDMPLPRQDPSRDPGGGAGPDALAALLQDVSRENESRVASMSYETMEEELRDAAAFFGPDALERLRGRRARARDEGGMGDGEGDAAVDADGSGAAAHGGAYDDDVPPPSPPPRHGTRAVHPSASEAPPASAAAAAAAAASAPAPAPAAAAAQGWPSVERRAVDLDPPAAAPRAPPAADASRAELESMRATYFPDEPAALPPALEWMVPQDAAPTSAAPRFDFHGDVLAPPASVEAPDATYLAGLHHHGSDPAAPGYTLDELLHLVRSHMPAQRVLALQVLGRVSARHPRRPGTPPPASARAVYAELDEHHGQRRAHILLCARWLLDDRHHSVRAAAAECLACALEAVAIAPRDAAAALAPVAADATLDWAWPATLDDAWAPACVPPPFHAADATLVEQWQHDWAAAFLEGAGLAALAAWVDAHGAGAAPAAVRILAALATHARAAAHAIARHAPLVHVLVREGATRHAWPLVGDAPPSVPALLALLRVVQSDRAAAAALLTDGALDPVMRYILLPPRDVSGAAPPRAAEHAPATLAWAVLGALGRYGLGSATVREVWAALPAWAAWAPRAAATAGAGDVRLGTASAFFHALAAWTHAAVSGPRAGDLGVNWPMVTSWATFSAPLTEHDAAHAAAAAHPGVVGAAATHAAAWLRGAQHLGVDDAQQHELTRKWDRARAWLPSLRSRVAAEATQAWADARRARDAPRLTALAAELADVATLIGALARIAALRALPWHDDILTLQADMLAQPWHELRAPAVLADGRVRALLPAVAAAGSSDATPALRMRSLAVLPPGDAHDALALMQACAREAGADVEAVLAPFLRANVRAAADAPLVPALRFDAAPTTLWAPAAAPAAPATDPRTGAALWQSPAAGLPLRVDWPFVALDDLLHSAEAYALNAADALPAEWDYAEHDIVRATLALALHVQAHAPRPSACVWLGIHKVFLLEAAPAGGPEASGAATGRDLYMRPEIARALAALMAAADAASGAGDLTLEEATQLVHAPAVPYYQMYTDLVGLYDAVSMHDALFARALVPPLAMAYPPDYRRLLWNDYAPLLSGLTLRVEDAPRVRGDQLDAYLWPCERDRLVLAAYANALARGAVTQRQPFLFAVARHHVAAALWAPLEAAWGVDAAHHAPPAWRAQVARAVDGTALADDLRAYAPRAHDAGARARQWAAWTAT